MANGMATIADVIFQYACLYSGLLGSEGFGDLGAWALGFRVGKDGCAGGSICVGVAGAVNLVDLSRATP
jgi:hypothetical protein